MNEIVNRSLLESKSIIDVTSKIANESAKSFIKSLRGPLPPTIPYRRLLEPPPGQNPVLGNQQLQNGQQYNMQYQQPAEQMPAMQPMLFNPQQAMASNMMYPSLGGQLNNTTNANTKGLPMTISKEIMDNHPMFVTSNITPMRTNTRALSNVTLYAIIAIIIVFVIAGLITMYRSRSKKKIAAKK